MPLTQRNYRVWCIGDPGFFCHPWFTRQWFSGGLGGADNELSCVGLKALLAPSVGGLKALAARGLLQSNTMYGGRGCGRLGSGSFLGHEGSLTGQ